MPVTHFVFFLLFPLPPQSTLFPYTTLFRSVAAVVIRRGTVVAIAALINIVPRPTVHVIVTVAANEGIVAGIRSEEHTSELQSRGHLVCRPLHEKKTRQPAEGVVANRASERV